MAEKVTTGGLKSFDYKRREQSKLTEEERQEIRNAYQRAEERKFRERKNKIILVITAIIILLIVLGFLLFR